MLFILKKLAVWIIIAGLAFAGYEVKHPHLKQDAVQLVASNIIAHSMHVQVRDLKARENPNGKGIFIHTKKKDGRGIERKALWIVFENEVFPLNSTAKELSPHLKWPEEIMPEGWQMTGLNLYSFHKPMQWVFG
ncbi:MAG TPA: hypothetical protein DIS66_01355 [Candidatus Omnitrophica bacterium]|nr:hypothetical protein [Candidatus Omnitrophota bacterium]